MDGLQNAKNQAGTGADSSIGDNGFEGFRLGATGLPSAGATSDESATVKRWRRIAGIDDEEE